MYLVRVYPGRGGNVFGIVEATFFTQVVPSICVTAITGTLGGGLGANQSRWFFGA